MTVEKYEISNIQVNDVHINWDTDMQCIEHMGLHDLVAPEDIIWFETIDCTEQSMKTCSPDKTKRHEIETTSARKSHAIF